MLAAPWTRTLAERLEGGGGWADHVDALALYGLTVLIAAPVGFGLLLNAALRRAEKKGRLRGIHHALGAHDARTSWDFAFQPLDGFSGTFVTIALADGALIGGMLSRKSWVSRSPTYPHDIFLEEQWALDPDGIPMEAMEPRRGVWVEGAQIVSVHLHGWSDD